MAKTSTGPTDRQDLHEPSLASAQLCASLVVALENGAQTIDSLNLEATGIAIGSQILTLDGSLPVEFLSVGDRVVTRSGARILRKISAREITGEMIQIAPGALGHDRPEQALLLHPRTSLHLRDWRAQALTGHSQALIAAERLVDGEFITREQVGRKTVFTLEFDYAEVIYADGVELGCDALRLRN